MRYSQIVAEADAAAQTAAQQTQREKLAAANDKAAKAAQTYQSAVRTAHDSAAAAKKKLAMPSPKQVVKPLTITRWCRRGRRGATTTSVVVDQGGLRLLFKQPAFIEHLLMENRNGLVVDVCPTHATGTAEPAGAARQGGGRWQGYDTAAFAASSRAAVVTPCVRNTTTHCASNIDGLTTRHAGYRVSHWGSQWSDQEGRRLTTWSGCRL